MVAERSQPAVIWGDGPLSLAIATGSLGELGLLEALARTFAAGEGAAVRWHKAGSGQAMALLRARAVDLILAHAPAAERRAVAEGWATGRALIGANEFFIVGPADDPAGIADAADACDAFRRIHRAGALFVSRGDESGTHQKEREIWALAGLAPNRAACVETHDFMTASLRLADARGGYFLTDSSTFIAARATVPRLVVLFRGGRMLLNPYHTLYPAPPAHGGEIARRFGAFLLARAGQAMIGEFGRAAHGEAMYLDAAAAAARLNQMGDS